MKSVSQETIAEVAAIFAESQTENTDSNMSKVAKMENHLECTTDLLNRMVSLNPSHKALMRVLAFYATDSNDKDKNDIIRTLMGDNGICELVSLIESSHRELHVTQSALEMLCFG